MTYAISIKHSAIKSLENIPKADRLRLVAAIDALRWTPAMGSPLKGELAGLRRIRVGVYRIVYQVLEDRLTILVLRIAHRRHVYR